MPIPLFINATPAPQERLGFPCEGLQGFALALKHSDFFPQKVTKMMELEEGLIWGKIRGGGRRAGKEYRRKRDI